jgi:hypothetical protein
MGGGATLKDEPGRARAQSPGLVYWEEAVMGRTEMEPARLAAMLAHPRFLEAARLQAENSLALHNSHPQLMRMMQDVRRSFLSLFVLYLDATRGVTLSTIQEFCAEIGLTSPGRTAAILMNLRMIGYLVRDPVQTDRRVRRYIPSPESKDLFSKQFRGGVIALSLIEPGALRVADRIEEPEIFRACITTLGRGLANAVKRKVSSAVSEFDGRNGGMSILYKLATSGRDGDTYPARLPVNVSVIGLSRQFKVSRSHVLRLLRDAEALGLLRRDVEETTVTLEEPLRAALVEYHAASLMGYAACICAALRAVGEDP